MRARVRLVSIAVAVGAATLLAACGSGSSSTGTTDQTQNRGASAEGSAEICVSVANSLPGADFRITFEVAADSPDPATDPAALDVQRCQTFSPATNADVYDPSGAYIVRFHATSGAWFGDKNFLVNCARVKGRDDLQLDVGESWSSPSPCNGYKFSVTRNPDAGSTRKFTATVGK